MQCSRLLLCFVLAILCSQTSFSQPHIVLTQVTSAASTVDITGAKDGSNRLFLVNKGGTIRIFDLATNTLLPGNFLNISSSVLNNGEQGLLGLVFHPNFATNGYFYVNYIHAGSGNTTISRFTATSPASNAAVDISTEVVLLSIPQPFTNHNGGDLNFGPDGYLYIGMGDGGSGGDPGNRAQNPQELLGKILRIDVNGTSAGLNYAIPASNPFAGSTSARQEIWALGVRNPWRFSFDRSTGDLWIADVGQDAWEEVDFQAAGSAGGQNYGWHCSEGTHPYTPAGCTVSYISPIFEYDHNDATGGHSITGGFVYRGTAAPALQGWYVAADYVSNNFWLIHSNGTYNLQTDIPITNPVTFGEDDNGELYIGSQAGLIYKVTSAALPIELLSFNGRYKDGINQLTWATATEKNGTYFQIEKKAEHGDFQAIGRVSAIGESLQQQRYSFNDPQAQAGDNVYRLRIFDHDGRFQYSPVVTITVKETANWQLSPNPASGEVTLSINGQEEPQAVNFKVFNANGTLVLDHQEIAPVLPFHQNFQLTNLPAGVYSCRLEIDGKTEIRRLVIQ